MMDHICISVIVPIYGVEQYIERCARSLFEQTMNEGIEYIFVDDCTKDNSIYILNRVLEDYPERRHQVTLLRHDVNKGLPQARKTGVMVAKGDYIAHCDSDDWVSLDMYKKLSDYAQKNDYDIVYCDYYSSDGINKKPVIQKTNEKLLQGPVWNKIVRRVIYHDNEIVYPTANKAEDGALMTQLSFYSVSVGYFSEPLYYYFYNPLSMSRIPSEEECLKRLFQEKENTALRIEFLENRGVINDYKTAVIDWKLLTRNNLLPLIGRNKYYKLWLNTYPEINKQIFTDDGFSLKAKFAFLFQIFRIYNLKKKIFG